MCEEKGQGLDIKFFIGNILVRIHFFIAMMRWTDLVPCEFAFPFPFSLTSTFLGPPKPLLLLLPHSRPVGHGDPGSGFRV